MASEVQNGTSKQTIPATDSKRSLSWPKVLLQLHIYVIGFISLGLLFEAHLTTLLFTGVVIFLGVLGMTTGAHRLWAHRSYEASLGLRIFLMLCQTLAAQGNIHDWAVWHRMHHKHFETENDPFLVHKGFWTAHVVSNCYQKTKKDSQLMKHINTEDLENDAVVVFQKKFYWLLMPIIAILLPINAPVEYWGDSVITAILISGFFRHLVICTFSYLIYSAMYIWGLKANDKYPADSMLVFVITKSHWLRYHQIIPWDYQVGEYSGYGDGFLTSMIRAYAAFGCASNLKTVNSQTMQEAVYNATVSGKTVDECVRDITEKQTNKMPNGEHLQTAKFL